MESRVDNNESRGRPRGETGIVLALTLLAAAAPGCHRRDSRPAAQSEVVPALTRDLPRAAARTEKSGYLFTDAEKSAIDEFLSRHPELRIATDEDRRGSRSGDGDVHGLYGIYHPYFVRGDLNDDGILDFVLAFVPRTRARGTPWFSVVVFTGRGGDLGFDPGSFLEREISLSRGDLSIDRDAIVVTPDLSDDSVRRYRWDPVHRSYVFVRDDDERDEAPAATQT